jgi:hypothetical protein
MQAFNIRVCAGCSILALIVLSWLPAQDMMRTGLLSGSQEHFLAYMISGLLVAAAMPCYRFVHVAIFYVGWIKVKTATWREANRDRWELFEKASDC